MTRSSITMEAVLRRPKNGLESNVRSTPGQQRRGPRSGAIGEKTRRRAVSPDASVHADRGAQAPASEGLLELAPHLLAVPLARERLLGAALVARLQVEGVLLDVLDDVFLLHFPLEAPESALDGLALLNLDF